MTRRNLFFALAAAIGLLGCAGADMKAGSNKEIQVEIRSGKIVVPEDPAVVARNQGAIIWNLPATGSYTFPRDGIVIDPTSYSPCHPIGGGKSFMCVKKMVKPGDLKYIVHVDDGANSLPPLDPWIINE